MRFKFALILLSTAIIAPFPIPGMAAVKEGGSIASERFAGALIDLSPTEERYDIAYLELRSALSSKVPNMPIVSEKELLEAADKHPEVARKLKRFRAAEAKRDQELKLPNRINTAKAAHEETNLKLLSELRKIGPLNEQSSRKAIFQAANEHREVKEALKDALLARKALDRAKAGEPALSIAEEQYAISEIELRLALLRVSVPLNVPITEKVIFAIAGRNPEVAQKLERFRAARRAARGIESNRAAKRARLS